MVVIKSVISIAVFAVAALAQSTAISFTSHPEDVQAGQSYTLTWEGGDPTAPVTIFLRKGESGDLKTVGALTTTATGGSYTWQVDSGITDGTDYALQIVQGDATNYHGPFSVSGGTGTALPTSTGLTAPTTLSTSGKASSTESASASASTHPSHHSNSTTTSSALTSSAASTGKNGTVTVKPTKGSSPSSTGKESGPTKVPVNGAPGLQSPVALIFGAIAAMLYFN